jgi:predicted ATP-grasp superfamily ATP-dependent carboligase
VSVVQSLGRRGIAVDVASADRDCLAFHSRHARKCLVQHMCPANAEFVDWLRRLDAAGSYHLVLPINEGSLAAIAELPDHDSLRQKAQLPFREAIFTALHKEKTRVLARECGIRTPETHYLTQDTFAESGSTTGKYPLVLKPSTSRTWIEDRPTTLRVKLVHNPEERIEALKTMLRHTPVLQQEFIPGSGYGIELLYRNGRMLWHFAHERIHELPLTGGASTYRRSLAAPPAMLAAAKTLLDKLNWHGWAMVEFRGDPQTFHLMEINPRVWGSISLSIKSGVDFPYAMYQLACSPPTAPAILPAACSVTSNGSQPI